MRRALAGESSDSSEEEDNGTNFKRRRSKRGRVESATTEAEVVVPIQDPRTARLAARRQAAAVVTRATTRSVASNEVSTTTLPVTNVTKPPVIPSYEGASNGINAIKCPVIITRQFSDGDTGSGGAPAAKPVRTVVVPVSSTNDSTKEMLTNGNTSLKREEDFKTPAEIAKVMGLPPTGLGQIMKQEELSEISESALKEMQEVLEGGEIVIREQDKDNILDFEEDLPIEEKVYWIIPELPTHKLDYPSLSQWRKVGARKESIRSETIFVDPKALRDLLTLKMCFRGMNEDEYRFVRGRSNPYETMGKGPFLSRAALKLANLDATFLNAITQPTTNSADKQSAVGPNELFYFADVCAGPGGFSEYILFKKKWESKGFGMTLKGDLDFDLWSSTLANAENFEAIYGPAGDGDIYNPKNTLAFINYIKGATEGRGVHVLLGDGGFDVDSKELQEVLSAHIGLSQCFVALALVRTGGMFICKLFDTFTPFTVGLIYLMYLSFELVAIHKPITSRPANSERYLICKWKKPDTEGVCAYLSACYSMMWQMKLERDTNENYKEDIEELVPLSILTENKTFFDYMVARNTRLAREQITALKKIVLVSRDLTLKDPRQETLKRKLFDLWKIPSASKALLCIKPPEKVFSEIVGTQNVEFLNCPEYPLLDHNVEAFIRSPYDWRIVVVGGGLEEQNRGFYLSVGRDKIYRYTNKVWTRIKEQLELSKDTLVYGEFVDEIYGKKPTQTSVRTFHIIDAMILGGVDVRSRHYTGRLEVCIKFAKSMNKPQNTELCQVRAKIPVRMENIADVFDRLENRVVVSCGSSSNLVCPVDHTDETLPFIQPSGILFLKITKDPWTMALSKSSNRKYYFNIANGQASYELVMESISEFEYTMQHRVVWCWDKDLKTILSTSEVTDLTRPVPSKEGILNPQRLLHYIDGEWQANRTAVMRRLSSSSSSQGST